jgi:hypothetical protein
MATGGFKRRREVEDAIRSGVIDAVGLARALILDPSLPKTWMGGGKNPTFPRFKPAPPGGITAWYTMRLTDLGEEREGHEERDVSAALREYEARDARKATRWTDSFSA